MSPRGTEIRVRRRYAPDDQRAAEALLSLLLRAGPVDSDADPSQRPASPVAPPDPAPDTQNGQADP
jgi:hypothetical protein